jgi:hypothetical protein
MKPRHHVYLDDELSARLDALSAKPGATKSGIVGDALRSHFSRRDTHQLEDRLRLRLDRTNAHLDRLERDLEILLESFALFVRYQFSVTAPLSEIDQAAARARAKDLYQAFIDQVGRRIGAGRTLSGELNTRTGAAGPEPSASAVRADTETGA